MSKSILPDDLSIGTIMYRALKTFPETMTRKELINECANYMKKDSRIWVKPETLARTMHTYMKDYLGYNRHKKIYTNYAVKDMTGRFRVR